MDTSDEVGNMRAQEHLDLLCSLTKELEAALVAITRNELPELEESIARQEQLAWRLGVSLGLGATGNKVEGVMQESVADRYLAPEIYEAHQSLRRSSRVYEAVLQHASHSGRLMLSLFDSCTGNFQEASGARRAHPTWSGQM